MTCLLCRARHGITAAAVLQADAETAWKRCAATVTYPAGAARIRCTDCGLFLLGPDLDEPQRAQLRITEGLAGLALRETYLAARQRAGRQAGQ
jgi:LSD1 subclass zinc finger protein